jgi:hypothetical protein
MPFFMIAFLFMLVIGVTVGVSLVSSLASRRELRPPTDPNVDRLLAEQAERISILEDELARLKEQADFTEKLLTERSSAPREDTAEGTHAG